MITINHVSIEVDDRKKAEVFFTQVLGLSKIASITLTSKLNENIFGKEEELEIDNYGNNTLRFEVFITQRKPQASYRHICIKVDNRPGFIALCKEHGVETNIVKKGARELLFIKDFSNNIYEVK